ncbi:bifunctional diaminohydroxyphosphoribosylaminopyrimidine deaminase/5-amino-6-(5-phosphoribosylamino)uracil reductase RibD [Mycetocola zhujimingii]|uniref:Riboflavin biosynthesis protein RibD n=1 Tax=Mycetocola zhujimingii TaxID=2079792 RepID=A0A2U1TFC5_9MICO|nr:bifunctional diaminohydroxyphosphoribosylaminopyrimidine deaminase/5-amino-6-(5-phosphoribosylamino)uracil reductase RibD [Mycetocola zhujimingii]PWC07520.1 bifunctional diaminohydroxyphosphoribosylaminopyrimidine deaminase/5-amino-6-(5-phosphoribosylamino)uracil reductase RibD [Mycetocola zhujimingii]
MVSDTAEATAGPGSAAIEAAMRQAFALARRGPKRGVNPRVGCVITTPDGAVIAEGWHRGAGTAHAEVDALSHLDGPLPAGSTAVVTLEPCNHTGRTGPCTQALINRGISRVVYSVADPGRHSGGGAERLRAAGVDVIPNVLTAEGEALIADWLRAARLGRPYVTAKWAQSLDGRSAAADGSSQWITGPVARADVHRRRGDADAIAVGTGTALADDPALTARAEDGTLLPDQPIPVIFGTRAVPNNARLLAHPHPPVFLSGTDLAADLESLAERGIRSLFVEGGPTLISALTAAGLVDEYLLYVAPTLLGGPRTALGDIGVGSIDEMRRLEIESVETLGDDLLIVALPKGNH